MYEVEVNHERMGTLVMSDFTRGIDAIALCVEFVFYYGPLVREMSINGTVVYDRDGSSWFVLPAIESLGLRDEFRAACQDYFVEGGDYDGNN